MDSLLRLFLDKEDSDVEVHLQTTQGSDRIVLPAHAFVLEQASKVFQTMLETGKFKEGITKVVYINVPGDETDAINFLRYMYIRKLGNLDLHSYIVLLQVAHLYEMESLVQMCEERIKNIVNPLSVCRVYLSLETVASEAFLLLCKGMMLKYAFMIFMENLHTCLSEETMRFLLESDDLNVLDEEQVLIALWMWARTNCQLETKTSDETFTVKLEKLLHLVRWSKVTNVLDAPWSNLVVEKKSLTSQNMKNRNQNHNISLKEISKILKWDCETTEKTVSFRHLYHRQAKQDFWASDLLFNPEKSDLEAHVETQGKEAKLVIPVHSFVLKIASKVFGTLLKKRKVKEHLTKAIEMKIPGDVVDVMIFFRYLYTKKLNELDARSYIKLMKVAQMYEVKSLFELCEKRLMDAVTPLSVCRVYCSIKEIASENIILLCKDIMLKFAFVVFMENLHTALNEEEMKFLLESDELNVLDELQALNALWVWARRNGLTETTILDDTVQFSLVNLQYLIRWSAVKNVPDDAPWFGFVQENKNIFVEKIRKSSRKISPKRFSNVLPLLGPADGVRTPEPFFKFHEQRLRMLDFDVSGDIFLTGLMFIVEDKYHHETQTPQSIFSFLINECAIDLNRDFRCSSDPHIDELSNMSDCVPISVTVNFFKPILLTSMHSNKIVINVWSDEPCFSTDQPEQPNIRSISSSGKVVDFVIKGKITAIIELYYIPAQ